MRATLVFVVRDGQVLLIRKKRGLGAGKVNGPGGKIDPGETPEECAVREVREELGITVTGLTLAGTLSFQFVDGLALFVHVFRASGIIGTPVETPEATPLWTAIPEIPYDQMWADDIFWLPHLIEGRRFEGRFDFDGDDMLSCQVTLPGTPAGPDEFPV